MAAIALLLVGLPVSAQFLPDLEAIDNRIASQDFIPVFNQGNVEVAPVFLNGRMVAVVPGYIRFGSSPDAPFSQRGPTANERSFAVHSRLQLQLTNLNTYSRLQLAARGVTDVATQRRELERLLDISVDQESDAVRVMVAFPKFDPPQLLYTVTPADVARVRTGSSNPVAIANRTAKGARRVLLQAWEEQQDPYLLSALRRSVLGLILLGGVSGLGVIVQKRLKRWQAVVSARFAAARSPTTNSRAGELVDSEPSTAALLNRTISLHQTKSLLSVYRSCLYWGQWLLWVCGIGFIAGLFPATRPFRNWLFGVSVYDYWARRAISNLFWPPLDWLASFGQQATIGLPLLILFLLILTQISIRIGHLICDVSVQRWAAAQTEDRLKLRVPTLAKALKNWIRVVVYLVLGMVVLYHLHQLGALTRAVAISLGFLSFALSLASQDLLKDLIGGFLILYEDQYVVGDVVIAGNQAGLVEQVGLRVTKLRNLDGELITIPNGKIEMVRNLSSSWSRVNYAIEVGISEDPDQVMAIMGKVGEELYSDPEWSDSILELPEILGIEEITHHGVLIRLLIKVQPLQQWAVAREYRRRLKHALDLAGISVGVPRLELEMPGGGSSRESTPA